MVRINLLPPEIIEKRKFEQRIGYVIVAGAITATLVALVYLFLFFQVNAKNSDLQQRVDQANQLRNKAEAYKVFEQKETDLNARIAIADQALASRVNWGRVANELSLVLPSDVWVDSIQATEDDGMVIVGNALDSATDVPDIGHKAVAKVLVRLADLELLDNVWLGSSTRSVVQDTEVWALNFQLSADVKRPAAPPSTSATVSAPPSAPNP